MKNRFATRTGRALLAVSIAAGPLGPVTAAFAACRADSGPSRAALVELYTSEGCSSCPPADRALRQLTQAGTRVVPLALHVDYWDSIGWKDRFAQPGFSERQHWEVEANRHRTSYTPHFFVNGREVLDWREDLDAELKAPSMPAIALIAVDAEKQGSTRLRLKVDGTVSGGGSARGPLLLFAVVTESRLASQVDAGENRGVRLEHDAVARNWIGPIAIKDGRVTIDRVVEVPTLGDGQIGVVAFIQDASTAEVLQAVGTGVCKPG